MSLNIDLFYFININLQNPFFDSIMPIFTNAGSFACLLTMCILAVIMAKHYKKDDWLEIAKLCLYALILSGIIAGCLKLAFHSPRPFSVLDNVRQLTVPSEPNSFPSGHCSSTFSVMTVLVWKLRENRILTSLLVLFALSIGFSRIYIGVHYPFDVFSGAIIGIISGVVVLGVKKHLKI